MASKSTNGNDEISISNSCKKQLKSGTATVVDSIAARTRNRVKPSSKSMKNSEQAAATTTVNGKSRSGKQSKRTCKEAESIDDDLPPTKQPHKSKDNDQSSASQHTTKRTRKALNKKERQSLCKFLNEVDASVLFDAARVKLSEQLLPAGLGEFVDEVFRNKQLIEIILVHHRERFVELFAECQKGTDSFLRFQLQWHQHCSAFLLAKEYCLSVINLDKSVETSVADLRKQWLDFCDIHHIAIDDSKKVMIPISSSVYELLLERSSDFQNKLDATGTMKESVQLPTDGDDVYLRFGGAALCDMLHQHYKQIKSCPGAQRDVLSQEITILQAINMKDKSKLPQYLMYRDNGYMYFPDVAFVPFLRSLDEIVRSVINTETIQDDDQIIKVTSVIHVKLVPIIFYFS